LMPMRYAYLFCAIRGVSWGGLSVCWMFAHLCNPDEVVIDLLDDGLPLSGSLQQSRC